MSRQADQFSLPLSGIDPARSVPRNMTGLLRCQNPRIAANSPSKRQCL